jgi:hypothetical protein
MPHPFEYKLYFNLKEMKHTALLWTIAGLLTIVTAVYQRLTGPTHPVAGSAVVHGGTILYQFERSHGGTSDHRVALETDLDASLFRLEWRRHKTADPWSFRPMARDGDCVVADLPHQPPAGKLLYRVRIGEGETSALLPAPDPVVIRFRGDVPLWVLVPHVLVMFAAMLFSTRTGLEALQPAKERLVRMKTLTDWTLGLLAAGGLVLGPAVQKYAFDAFWTGWPFGTDLTDNKTLVAFLCWVAAWISLRKASRPGTWVLGAAISTLAVFLIPHSLLGSELDYSAAGAPALPPAGENP